MFVQDLTLQGVKHREAVSPGHVQIANHQIGHLGLIVDDENVRGLAESNRASWCRVKTPENARTARDRTRVEGCPRAGTPRTAGVPVLNWSFVSREKRRTSSSPGPYRGPELVQSPWATNRVRAGRQQR